jgi:hypothetical protein
MAARVRHKDQKEAARASTPIRPVPPEGPFSSLPGEGRRVAPGVVPPHDGAMHGGAAMGANEAAGEPAAKMEPRTPQPRVSSLSSGGYYCCCAVYVCCSRWGQARGVRTIELKDFC